jgi:Rrf2 family protein
MIMISQKARYALHSLIVLARQEDDAPMMSADIARIANVPHKFLQQILLEMKKNGIVHSQRGRQGGYTLGRDARQITFADIIRASDGPFGLTPCANILIDRHCVDCADKEQCDIRRVLTLAHEATAKVLEAHTLAAPAVPSGSLEIRTKPGIA